MSDSPLENIQHETFCNHMVFESWSVREAAIAAGVPTRQANRVGSEFMRDLTVQVRIEILKAYRYDELATTRERIIHELGRVAEANMQDAVDEDGKPLPLPLMDRATAAAVQSIKHTHHMSSGKHGDSETITTELKMVPKVNALEKMGKHFNIFEDHQKAVGTGEIHITISDKDAQL